MIILYFLGVVSLIWLAWWLDEKDGGRNTFTILLLVLCFHLADAQFLTREEIKTIYTRSALVFGAGAINGIGETIQFHYQRFERVHPGANPQFWDPKISWENKYVDWPENTNPRFIGSTTFLAWATDGYHLMRTGERTALRVAMCIPMKERTSNRRKFTSYLVEYAIYSVVYSAGFTLTYSILYHK